MALLDIIVAPDPRLKKKAASVERVDAETARLMDDMLETMYDAPGVGLAAPQVGVSKRIIVVDPARDGEDPQPLKMANPEINWLSGVFVALSRINHGDAACKSRFAILHFVDFEGLLIDHAIDRMHVHKSPVHFVKR